MHPKLDCYKPNISLSGNECLLIEGYKGLADYNDTVVKISISKGILEVKGVNLDILRMDDEIMVLKGEIHSVCFIER